MSPADRTRLADKILDARRKVGLTVFNDPMPSARLMASMILLNEVIAELRGETPTTENHP